MTGTFIVSLDCEGKWGMADVLRPYHNRLLTDAALAAVYDDLVSLFARHDVPATFAYVMALTLRKEERRQLRHLLEPGGSQDGWLRHHWAAMAAGETEGWFQPHALDAVMADGRHEIACHGFCHRPLGDHAVSREGAERELDAALEVARMKGVAFATLIFPRNEVGHLEVVRSRGFLGYRERLRRPGGFAGKALSFVDEFNIWPQPECATPHERGQLARIPAGRFFNWRSGRRRLVPPAATVQRWKRLLRRAVATGTVAHLWLHPHNLITGPGTREPLERILAYAAQLRARGQLKVLTQEQYCREMERSGSTGSDARDHEASVH